MRAILINTIERTITEVEYTGNFRNIYTHIDADCFDVLRFGDAENNTIYVDDNGLNNGKQATHGMFRVEGRNPAYLAGHGLILATNKAGDSVGTKMDIEKLKKIITFGSVVRLNGEIVFLELKPGEEVGPHAANHNRIFKIDN